MSHQTSERPPQTEDWTIDHVYQWLLTDVKVSPVDAKKFIDEDVSGKYLVDFNKTDILDLEIKHGPAVKIAFHLKRLKKEPLQEPQYPPYVLAWTKEQVNQWLLQHRKLYDKNAQRLLNEDVSGDCLVCFEKQDFKDVDIKQGPAKGILTELTRLKDKPEPALQPIVSSGPDNEDQTNHGTCHGLNVNLQVQMKAEQRTNYSSENVQKPPENKDKIVIKQSSLPVKKEKAEATKKTDLLEKNQTTIYEVLKHLQETELKHFMFQLENYTESKYKPIPRSKLENIHITDICRLINENYVEEAFTVTANVLRKIQKNDLALDIEKARSGQLERRPSTSKSKTEADQGDKLKNLLTCGGNSLNDSLKFVVVVNKSRPEQVQYLQFLSKLQLFCVLDFDPKSICPGGVCHSYRELRVANLHSPSQYQGGSETIIKKLNLHKQTSWVFCKGRGDLDEESHMEVDYKTWLKTSCRDVEQLVSFICKHNVVYHGRFLIIFLLLSPVKTEKDPVFETYKCFYKNTSENHIITLCDSQSVYSKWKQLIGKACESDIDARSVNELSLSEINGTIMALGPFSQSSEKLLPSSDSSFIVLKQKDEDLLTALEVLSVNQCKNLYDERSEEFKKFKLTQEEEFYRGGKVTWWNFYFCDIDRTSPFIKRDKYRNVKKMIRNLVKDPQNSCVLFKLFHDPGCGATTLAMNVMWDLRKELRCAVLKDNTVSKEEVANQVIKFMKLENEKPCTVLLLVDDSKETDSSYELENCIHKSMDMLDNSYPCKVIVLNCVRSHRPQEQYREHSPTQSQYITASLSPQEQLDFETKLKKLKEIYTKPENFYSFMIMKSNFDPQYTRKLALNTLETFDAKTKTAKLFAFLALLNNFVDNSEISLSLCGDFLRVKTVEWQEYQFSVLNKMAQYSKLLIIEKAKNRTGYSAVRILHNHIAAACLEVLEERHKHKVSDITLKILDCDLFYNEEERKEEMRFIRRMLIERQRKKDNDERELFSVLVEKIHKDEGRQTVQGIFVKASSRFETTASIPQAFARYLYKKEQDFEEALSWAQNAKDIAENPFTLDTIAQVYKSNLKYNMEREKQETSYNPEDLEKNLELAENAIFAFQEAQNLAQTNVKDEPDWKLEDDLDNPNKSYNVYGYVGVVEITFLVFEVLSKLPFFENKMYLKSFLEKNTPISDVPIEKNEVNKRYRKVIWEKEGFLQNLSVEVKQTFKILEDYYTYLKANDSEYDPKNRQTVREHFTKYVTLFCTEPEQVRREGQRNPILALQIKIEQKRQFLQKERADIFSGILQHLSRQDSKIEEITKSYAFLYQHKKDSNKTQATKDTINYILCNIVLHVLKPDSKHQSYSVLSGLLKETLQTVGLHYNFPDPYYTALLLFWPNPSEKNTEIHTYVKAIRQSSRRHLSALLKRRSTVAHLYLGKGEDLKRLVSKLQLDEHFIEESRDSLAQLWRSGDIFENEVIKDRLLRVSGTVEQGEVFANYGGQKIPVWPALNSDEVRSGCSKEKVSFYLGFAINGPLAYDIKNE